MEVMTNVLVGWVQMGRILSLVRRRCASPRTMMWSKHSRRTDPISRSATPILPGRGWCGRLVPDAHGTQSACEDRTIDAIPVADHVARSVIPRECFCDLARNPFCGRICCDADPDQFSAIKS